MGIWSDLLRTKSARNIAEFVGEPTDVATGEAYISVDLNAMHIADVRKGLTTFYPAVHSNIGIPHLSGEVRQFQTMSTPSNFGKLDARHLDRVIVGPLLLLNNVPYRGGPLEVEVGLFSIEAADLAGPYLKLLADISTKAGVSFVGAAKPFVDILHSGFQAIAGGDTFEIGRASIFDPPKSGRYIIVRATRDEMADVKFSISADGRELFADGKAVSRPYMILNFRVSPVREDWFLIPELRDAYGRVEASVRKADWTDVQTHLRSFRLIALTCHDLLPVHAKTLVAEIEEYYANLLSAATEAKSQFDATESRIRRRPSYRDHVTVARKLQTFDPFGEQDA